MSAGTYNLTIDQGSDFALDLVIKQSGSALDLSNYSGRAQLRTSVDASSVSATFTVTKTNASGGALKMELQAATSSALSAGQYVYDLEIYTASDAAVSRLLKGTCTIDREITRA